MARDIYKRAEMMKETAPATTAVQPVDAPEPPHRPKTAPGALAKFMVDRSSVHQEAEQLRAKLKTFEGSLPVRRLDAKSIAPSEWANRTEDSYKTDQFAQLKTEIGNAGGNVQPIKVRSRSTAGPQGVTWEIVFGHRRHRACLELGLPVLAMIDADLTDQHLYVEMERENRQREDLSAWEQGVMYLRALEQGLFTSNKQLAAAIDVDLSQVGKAIGLAKLPPEVVSAFSSPLDLQFRWSAPLKDALQRDPEGVLERARRVAQLNVRPAARSILSELLGDEKEQARTPSKDWKNADGKLAATMSVNAKGQLQLTFVQPLDSARQAQFERLVEQFLVIKTKT